MTIKSDGGSGDAAHRNLALAPNIHKIGAVGDDEADADQRESDAAIDRRGDGIGRTDGPVDERRDGVQHGNTHGEDQRDAKQRRCQHGGHRNHDRRPQHAAEAFRHACHRVGHGACPAIMAPICSRSRGSAAQLPMIRPR